MAEEERKEPKKKLLTVSTSPHLTDRSTSKQIMYEVVIGMLPVTLWSIYLYRHMAVIVLLTCLAGCLGTEWLFNLARKRPQTITDGSGIVTALILGLSLPPTLPWWAALIGSVAAIGAAKMLFGGLGSNIFNPAMVGRAFLMACFGTMMTTWAMPFQTGVKITYEDPAAAPSAITQPTPLALAKDAIKHAADPDIAEWNKQSPDDVNIIILDMFTGNMTVNGSTGETSALLWLIGGVFLLFRRTITYHIPLAVLGSSGVIATAAWWANPEVYINPLAHLCGGGLMMCAFFIATDLVTCPLSKRGRVIFGIGVGTLIMLIRLKGGYPEGVMYAVLLMNAMTPLLDRWTRPKPLGGHVSAD
ncbi:MAG: hypothetical protein AMJ79_12640 [Phycisphaerae bacterium SM23_30]|nr:MAG: hypothetical protein AMJ79_12640 [Phycisphaerae bacterium SM23_30]